VSNVLPREKRLAVLAALVDGNSERATERLTGVTQKTIGAFALRLGGAALNLHNEQAHDLSCSLIENDEIWSYVGKKQARVTPEEHAAGLGEAYTFTGLAMPSRYVVAWKVGKRDEATADAYLADLRSRLVVMPAMTSDGFAPYISAIGKHLGPGVDYAQTIKNYTKGGRRDDDHRYEPPRDPFITKRAIFGAPNVDAATTAHIERHNGTMRHHIGRMRRLCYAFSKSPAHHVAAVSLCLVHYNLCWIPRTLRVTPAMAAGVTRSPWDLPELLDALLGVRETATPERKPLAPRKPEGTARELPNGRGFLRVVQGNDGPAAPPPAPATPPAAPVVPVPAVASAGAPTAPAEPVAPPPADDRQLDLLSWKPRQPREPSRILPAGQLHLFGLDMEPPREK
jgi:IS1 family transposase